MPDFSKNWVIHSHFHPHGPLKNLNHGCGTHPWTMLELSFLFYCLLFSFSVGSCVIGKSKVSASVCHNMSQPWTSGSLFLFSIHLIVNFSFNNFRELPQLSFKLQCTYIILLKLLNDKINRFCATLSTQSILWTGLRFRNSWRIYVLSTLESLLFRKRRFSVKTKWF